MNSISKAVVVVVATLFAAGCVKRVSFEESMAAMCDAPNQVDRTTGSPDPAEIASRLSEKMTAAVKDNAEAKQLLESFATAEPADKTAKLREAVKRAGLSQCTLAEIWEAPVGN